MLRTARRATEATAVVGCGGYLPRQVVTNDDIGSEIDSTDEWIRARSGIRERRFAGAGETVVSMAVAAGVEALASAGVVADDVGCVIVATSTHLLQTPSAAARVASEIGAVNAGAFDLSAGCSGFCHALALASDSVSAGSADYVLVIGAERLSDNTDRTDRSTAFIFGDGAGAVVVGPAERVGIGPVVWGADGAQYEAICQSPAWDTLRSHREVESPAVRMNGGQVYRWATTTMPDVARRILDLSGLTVAELDVFIPHQANQRITDCLTRALDIDPASTVVATSVETLGNTSAASVPLALIDVLRSGKAGAGDTALLMAFGAGLSWAGQVITLPSTPARLVDAAHMMGATS